MKKVFSLLTILTLATSLFPVTVLAQTRTVALSIPGVGDLGIGGDSGCSDCVPIDVQKDKPAIQLESEMAKAKASAVQKLTLDASQYLQKKLAQIEKDYKISNFLYYNDALTAKYADDFLQKYVAAEDQQIVRYMIPQFACSPQASSAAQQQKKNTLLNKKAQDYLGYDPTTLSSSDPYFYEKLARMGDVYANPLGWDLQLQAAAAEASQSAGTASQNEIDTSQGLKVPRSNNTSGDNTVSEGDIMVTANNLIQFQSSALSSQLQSGFENAQFDDQILQALQSLGGSSFSWSNLGKAALGELKDSIGKIAAGVLNSLTQSIYNQLTNATFIKGAKLIQEKKTCLDDSIPAMTMGQTDTTWGSETPTTGTGGGTSQTDQSSSIVFVSNPSVTAAPGDPITLSWNTTMVQGAVSAIASWSGAQLTLPQGQETVVAPSIDTDYTITVYDLSGTELGHSTVHIIIDAGPRG